MFKVLKDWKGSPDGFTVIDYKEGQIVDLVPSLSVVALAEKWVEEISQSVYEQAPIKVSRRNEKKGTK